MSYRPWTNRYVGIEMEINSVDTNGAQITEAAIRQSFRAVSLRDVSVTRAAYYHSNGQTWDVKTDSSCGWEIASPKLMLDEHGHNEELRKACEGLRRLSPSVNVRCGLHVHVDVSDFTWADLQKLVALWCRYEPSFYELTPASRRTNHYCAPLRMSTWAPEPREFAQSFAKRILDCNNERDLRALRGAPRGGLNLAGWWHSGRIEFRLQGGTIQYEKIRHWCGWLLSLVGRVKAVAERGAPRIQTSIRQKPEYGFSMEYICKVLGMTATPWNPEPHAFGLALAEWGLARRATLAARPVRGRRGTMLTHSGATVPEPVPGYASMGPTTVGQED